MKPEPTNHNLRNVDQLIAMLEILEENPCSTMMLIRKTKLHTHYFYRIFRYALKHRLIQLVRIEEKYGMPTKVYALTTNGRELLEVWRRIQRERRVKVKP